MSDVDNIYLFSAGVELFAAAVMAVLLLGCRMERQYMCMDKTNRLFVIMLAIQMLLLIGDAAIWVLLSEPSPDKIPLVKTLTLLTDIMTVTLTAFYINLLTNYISQTKPVSSAFSRIVSAICGAIAVLWIICLFNDWYIWYGADGSQHEGPIYEVIWLLGVLLMISSAIFVLCNHKALGRRDTVILSTYGLFPLAGYLLEYYWPVTPLLIAPTLSLLLMYVVIHMRRLRRSMAQELKLAQIEAKVSRQEVELSQSRINIMLSQIQPHFLFNALTSISALCEKDPIKAQSALNNFSDFLRGNLDSLKRAAPIPFDKELKHVKIYLSLEKMRFESELNIVYDIEASGFLLPALTVQPLVENAVKYGVGKKPGGGTVTISTREQGNCYLITVSDDGVGYDPYQTQYDGRMHIGIDNVRSRLETMVGGMLTIVSQVGMGTVATIQIPKGGKHEHTGS